jgi:cytidylate kinase
MAEEDAGRRDYLKRFYSVERESPEQYDLVVNTRRMEPTAWVPLIAAATRL